jgi:septal ring factor EnvC (AmiA/AmiB activator)
LDKKERNSFDEMWDIPKLYTMACSNSASLVPFHPIAMSILFHHYKELNQCIKEIEQIEEKARASSSKKKRLTKKEEELSTTLDSFTAANSN